MSKSCFQRIYKIVKKIPRGKVATYGQIAKEIQNSIRQPTDKVQNDSLKFKVSARVVGFALHANKSSLVPCHRVVNKEGRLAPGYAFGGANIQKEKLLKEGVIFKDKGYVDLEKCLWEP